jgi:beta-glucosidase
MGCSFDDDLVYECADMARRESSVCGVHVTFNPMVDTARDPRWGRILETNSEEPLLNGRMGAALVRATQGDDLGKPENVACCVKHYAAYGAGEAGRDYNTVDVSERMLRETYLPAYKACLDAGARLIMPSFNALNGVPSVANKYLMNDILRKEWGFDGVVISDYNAVGELVSHGVAADLKEAARLAMEAGCDIDMVKNAYYLHLADLVREGAVSEKAVDVAVMRGRCRPAPTHPNVATTSPALRSLASRRVAQLSSEETSSFERGSATTPSASVAVKVRMRQVSSCASPAVSVSASS